MKRSHVLKLREMMHKASASLPDEDALDAVELFPVWQTDTAYILNVRVRYGDKLYKCVQAHTSQFEWTPDVTPALWTEVETPGQGDTPENPIPYSGNMALAKDKYYSQYDKVYVCTRDTINPVYADLADLVGLYVEEVSENE